MKIETDFGPLVDAIAAAVVKKIKAEGGKVTEAAPPNGKPAGEQGGKVTGKKAPAKGPKREDVLAKVRALGEAKGKPAAKELISKYAEAFGDVKDEDLGKLLADVEAALAGEETSAEEEEDF